MSSQDSDWTEREDSGIFCRLRGPLQAVIFDFDYTLADASDAIVHCVQHAFASLGWIEPEPSAVRATIGLTLSQSCRVLTGRADESEAQRFVETYMRRADEVMLGMTRVFEDVEPVARALSLRGIERGIVSTKLRHRIEATLHREGLSELFPIIVGGEDVMTHKPDPEGLWVALERLSVAPTNALYVGDSRVDAETAAGAGTSFLPVLTGVTPAERFEDLPGLPPIATLGELIERLDL